MAPAFVVLARFVGLGFLFGAGAVLFRHGGTLVPVGVVAEDENEVGAEGTLTGSMRL